MKRLAILSVTFVGLSACGSTPHEKPASAEQAASIAVSNLVPPDSGTVRSRVHPSDTLIQAPPDLIRRTLETPLGGTLGDWRAVNPGDHLTFGAYPNWSAISSDNTSGPLEGIYCARAEATLASGKTWRLRRLAFFNLIAPEGLPPAGMSAEAIRDRYCRAVVIGAELSGDTIQQVPDSLEVTRWADWNDQRGSRPPHSWEGGVDLPGGAHVLGLDGTARGTFEAVMEPTSSCFEHDGEGYVYDADPLPPCAVIFRSDTGVRLAWESGVLSPLFGREAYDLMWMIQATPGLPEATTRVLEGLARDTTERELSGHPDSTVLGTLEELKRAVVSATGERRVRLMMLLDLAMDRAVVAGRAGPTGDAGPETSDRLAALGGSFEYEHLAAAWVDHHAWLDSADAMAPGGELGDSIFVWFWQQVRACDVHQRVMIEPFLSRMRKYATGDRPARTRARAFLTIAQYWTDSITGAIPASTRHALVDSVAASLRAGLEADARVEYAADAHGALWRAEAGLIPLRFRTSCSEGD